MDKDNEYPISYLYFWAFVIGIGFLVYGIF